MKTGLLKRWFNNKNFLRVFSLVVAALAWLVVAVTTSNITDQPINNVPISLDLQSESFTNLGLTAIEGAKAQVNITVRGERTIVGGIKASDIKLSAIIPSIAEPRTYDLEIKVDNAEELGITEVVKINPPTIKVRFDRMETKTFDIIPMINGLSTPDGYATDQETVSPNKLVVQGPQADIDRISKAVIAVELTEPLTRTYADERPILLLDAQGEILKTDKMHLYLDKAEAQVIIKVLRLKTLPLRVGFTGQPTGFPIDELREKMIISDELIQIAGPVDLMDNHQEIMLGYINISEMTIENSTFSFEVILPSGSFTNIDNVNNVLVNFDTSDWQSNAYFISDIAPPINVPVQFDVNVLSKGLSNVVLVGQDAAMENIKAEDIVVEIDLSGRVLTPGQYTYPVTVSVPGKGLVWAVGDYSVLIQVAEKAVASSAD